MPVSDSDGLYLAGSSFRETSGYSRATRESLPTSACNTQKKHPPMDFDRLPDQKDLTKRRAAFDTGDVNARGEPGK
ncbi:hypothetical protein [Burkholderia cepacia]|uniref:hypothetical protein n=1 Tax=Burkholderia cepacia TaxID=292 RepID=UPI002FE3F8C6